ncbi:MAG: PKD domain-containing protein, partial [Candidatus Zixiibacteriota bacterium]
GTLSLDGIDATGLTFSADTTVGWMPLNVNFTATSKFPVDIWTWDFGDGDSAFVQNPSHMYQNPGPYDVKLETVSGVDIRFKTKKNYIAVLADTVIGSDAQEKVIQSRFQSMRIIISP